MGLVLGLAWCSLVVHSQLSLAGVQAAVFQVVEVADWTHMSLKAVDIDRKLRVRWCSCISPFGQSTHHRRAVLALSIVRSHGNIDTVQHLIVEFFQIQFHIHWKFERVTSPWPKRRAPIAYITNTRKLET